MQSREIIDGVHWMYHCYDMGDAHMHLGQYLVESGDEAVLIDAGSGDAEEFREVIGETTERPIEALLLTQSVLPHTQNVDKFMNEWADARVVSAAISPARVNLPADIESKYLNSTIEIAGHEYTYLDPLVSDILNSVWIYSNDHKVLFTAEGVGHYHAPGDCASTSEELDNGIPIERIHSFHMEKLGFLGYIDPAKLRSAFDAVIDTLEIEVIAPIHGNPILKQDIPIYLNRVIKSVERFNDEFRPEHPVITD